MLTIKAYKEIVKAYNAAEKAYDALAAFSIDMKLL